MKKSVALAIAAAMSLSVAGTALAQNPFNDVPQGHWAYDAIAQLEKDGLVTGYGDGTYRGDRAMSRYEMATVVAQLDDANGENAEMINRLRSEFATELYNLGVRVDRLEKNASSIKFSGESSLSYIKNTGDIFSVVRKDGEKGNHKFEQGINIYMEAEVNKNLQFLGSVSYTNTSNEKSEDDASVSYSGDVWLDRAELIWTSGSFEGRFGRINPMLGQGLIWAESAADGALIGYKTDKWDIFGGVLDYSPTYQDNNDGHGDGSASTSRNATVANIGYNFNDRFQLTAAYSNGHGNSRTIPSDLTDTESSAYELMAFGFNANFGSNWNLNAEYIKNKSDLADLVKDYGNRDNDGYWIRATYGEDDMNKKCSFSIYAEYLSLGGASMDFASYGHGLDVPGSDIDATGAKGYGIGLTYVPAKNMNIQFIFHDLKSKDANYDYKNSYQVITNFRF